MGMLMPARPFDRIGVVVRDFVEVCTRTILMNLMCMKRESIAAPSSVIPDVTRCRIRGGVIEHARV